MERCYMEAFLFVFLYQCLFSSDKVRVNKNKQTHKKTNSLITDPFIFNSNYGIAIALIRVEGGGGD